MAIDLNRWHHAIHQVTGDMAQKFVRAAAGDLQRWARTLRVVAGEMEQKVTNDERSNCPEAGVQPRGARRSSNPL